MDVSTFVGTFGLFLTLFLLFIRFLPMIAMAEVKQVLAHSHSGHAPGAAAAAASGAAAGEESIPLPEAAAGAPPAAFALVGVFDTPAALLRACEALRDAGYRKFDARTPFPVHGLERAMGLRRRASRASPGRWGCRRALWLGLQMWTLGVDYPLNLSGKPFFAYQAYVPVTFELTILLSAIGTFLGLWALNGPTPLAIDCRALTEWTFSWGIGDRHIRFLRWRTRRFTLNAGSHTTKRLKGKAK